MKEKGGGSRVQQGKPLVYNADLTPGRGKGKGSNVGQGESQTAAHIWQDSAMQWSKERGSEKSSVGQRLPGPVPLGMLSSWMGLPRKSVTGLENWTRSKDTTARDF